MADQYHFHPGQPSSPGGLISQHSNKYVDDFILLDEIGSGEYGKVYKARHLKTNELFAAKVLSLKAFSASNRLQEMIYNEVQTLQKISSPNIIKIYKLLKTTNNVYLIYEFCDGGTVEQLLQRNKLLTETQALSYFRQIFDAVHTLIQNNVLHRDIKLANIFLHQGSVKLGDFGFCVLVNHENREYLEKENALIGTPLYMAPEVLNGAKPNSISEIYSLGVVLYEMLYGACPYEDENTTDLKTLLEKQKNLDLELPRNINRIGSVTEAILKGTLKKNPAERMGWEELKTLLYSSGRAGSSSLIMNKVSPVSTGASQMIKTTSVSPRRAFGSPSNNEMPHKDGSVSERKDSEKSIKKNFPSEIEARSDSPWHFPATYSQHSYNALASYQKAFAANEEVKPKPASSFEGSLPGSVFERKPSSSSFSQQVKKEGGSEIAKNYEYSPRLNRNVAENSDRGYASQILTQNASLPSREGARNNSSSRTYESGNDYSSKLPFSPSFSKGGSQQIEFLNGANFTLGASRTPNMSQGSYNNTASVLPNKDTGKKGTPQTKGSDSNYKTGVETGFGINDESAHKIRENKIRADLNVNTSEFNETWFDAKKEEKGGAAGAKKDLVSAERGSGLTKEASGQTAGTNGQSVEMNVRRILFKERNKIVYIMQVLKDARDLEDQGQDFALAKFCFYLLNFMLKLSNDLLRNLKDNPRSIFKSLLFDWRDYEKTSEYYYIEDMLQRENKNILTNLKEFADEMKTVEAHEPKPSLLFASEHYLSKEEFAEEAIYYVQGRMKKLEFLDPKARRKLSLHLLQTLDAIQIDEFFEELISNDGFLLEEQTLWRELEGCSNDFLQTLIEEKVSLFGSLYSSRSQEMY